MKDPFDSFDEFDEQIPVKRLTVVKYSSPKPKNNKPKAPGKTATTKSKKKEN